MTVDVREFEYDTADRLISTTLPAVDDPEDSPDMGETVQPQYRYFYDDYGNQVGILDAKDRLTVFKYNELNNQTAKYQPFVPTDPLPANINTAANVYTALSNASPQPLSETMGYDELGRIKVHIDFEEQATGYVYDSFGRLEYKRFYDKDSTPGNGTNDNYPLTWAEEIQYTYDDLGRRETVIEARGNTSFNYDAEGRIIQVDSPEGVVNYDYDSITGQKIRTWTAANPTDPFSSAITVTEYTHDQLGRLDTVLGEGDAQSADYDYNPVGSRKSMHIIGTMRSTVLRS
jgi:uncharacterized protein RhaS with RHS repeats